MPYQTFINQAVQQGVYAGKRVFDKTKPKKEGSSVPYAAIIQGALQLAQSNQAAYQENQARLGALAGNKETLRHLAALRKREAWQAQLNESQLRAGQGAQLEGFAGARQAINLAGRQNRMATSDAAKQAQAGLEQSIISGGLQGTTVAVGQAQGLQAQTSRALADIDSQLAQAVSDLNLAEGGVKAGQSQQLVDFAQQRQARESEIDMAIAQVQAAIAASKRKKVKGWKKIARYAGVDPLGIVDPELSQFGTGGVLGGGNK